LIISAEGRRRSRQHPAYPPTSRRYLLILFPLHNIHTNLLHTHIHISNKPFPQSISYIQPSFLPPLFYHSSSSYYIKAHSTSAFYPLQHQTSQHPTPSPPLKHSTLTPRLHIGICLPHQGPLNISFPSPSTSNISASQPSKHLHPSPVTSARHTSPPLTKLDILYPHILDLKPHITIARSH